MSRRIDIELTSERPDGVWTWRAAGAKQPRGELDGGLLFTGAKVGDVVRADADFDIDGITVTSVLPPKGARQEPERLEIIGTPKKLEPVTSTLVTRGKGDRGDRRDRGDRGERGDRDKGRGRGRPGAERGNRPGGDRPGGDRPGGDRSRGRSDRGDRGESRPRTDGDGARRPPRKPRPEVEAKPKPKRLKAGRAHRNAVLADLPPEQRPIAEQVLRGGLPAVRQAVEKQNETGAAEGKPPVKAEPLLALAEQMLPRLRAAEWRDKAEAALADVAEIDLRDLRSVIVAADGGARDDESRALADQLRTALARRVEQEHGAWLAEIASTLADGRCVRALRLSSRPPKAGAPLPADMATRLAEATSAALTSDVAQDRWATVLDALAFSPVRLSVVPESLPTVPSDQLLAEVSRLATQIPQIATVFGVEPADTAKRPRPRPPRGDRKPKRVPPPPPAGGGAGDAAGGPGAGTAPAGAAATPSATDADEAASAPPPSPVTEAAAVDEADAPPAPPADDGTEGTEGTDATAGTVTDETTDTPAPSTDDGAEATAGTVTDQATDSPAPPADDDTHATDATTGAAAEEATDSPAPATDDDTPATEATVTQAADATPAIPESAHDRAADGPAADGPTGE